MIFFHSLQSFILFLISSWLSFLLTAAFQLSVCLPFLLSTYLSIYLFFCHSLPLFISLYHSLFLYFLSLSLPISLFISVWSSSVHISIHICICIDDSYFIASRSILPDTLPLPLPLLIPYTHSLPSTSLYSSLFFPSFIILQVADWKMMVSCGFLAALWRQMWREKVESLHFAEKLKLSSHHFHIFTFYTIFFAVFVLFIHFLLYFIVISIHVTTSSIFPLCSFFHSIIPDFTLSICLCRCIPTWYTTFYTLIC